MLTKIGLALGGGGARGLSHIGVLKVFERAGIPIVCIAGSSIGAVVGGAYSLYGDAKTLEEFACNFIEQPFFKKMNMAAIDPGAEQHLRWRDHLTTTLKWRWSLVKGIMHTSIYDIEEFEKLFTEFGDATIESLPHTFCAIASDLRSGEEIVIDRGNLKTAIMASSAIPGIFPPIEYNNRLLVDGSASDSVPVHILKERGADRVIAVNVTKCIRKIGELSNALHILYRADEIASYHLTQERLHGADLVIRPNVGRISWANFKQARRIIALGEQAAEKMLPQVERIMAAQTAIF